MTTVHPLASPGVRALALGAIPALGIGVFSAVALWGLDELSELLHGVLWGALPHVAGLSPDNGWWILGVLTVTGLVVGVVARYFPGHGGHDSATIELVAPVLPLRALPGVVIVLIVGIAGGVSLGPESPLIGFNTAVVVAVIARLMTRFSLELAVMLTASGTIGAMFGTPVAAALVFTALVAAAKGGGATWDRLFLPVVSAGAASVTILLLHGESFAMKLPRYENPQLLDLATAGLVAVVAAAFGILGAVVFPHVHRAFHALKNPVLFTTLGGLILGLLGVLGGPLTLFKGLHETAALLSGRDSYAVGGLIVLCVIKLVAILVSASAGFRGGRVFPAVFIGVAIGLIGHQLLPTLPVGLAVASGVMGVVLAVTREGWLALFIGVAVVSDIGVLPSLCIAILPAWLIITKAPEFIVHTRAPSSVPSTERLEPR
jgi:H+/Cl- antiporter ClcA